MHIVIMPNLDGLAGERLRAFAARLTGFASGDPAIRAATLAEIQAAKDDIRRELRPALAARFVDPLVRAYIHPLSSAQRN